MPEGLYSQPKTSAQRGIQKHHDGKPTHQPQGRRRLVPVAVGFGITSWLTTKIIAPPPGPC